MAESKKQILSKFEWFLLLVALGILALVLLQNQGIYPIETVESTKISKVEEEKLDFSKEKTLKTPLKKDRNNNERINSLLDYFAENRAKAKAEGKDIGFDWSSLKITADEEDYLRKKYGEPTTKEPSNDWLAAISNSYQTYKSVKSAFEELGIDVDRIITPENAAKAMSNPILANSIYQKMENDFGIPAEKSKAFAEKNQQNLEKWAGFVEREMRKK